MSDMSDQEFYDDLEIRDPEVRDKEQMAALSEQVAHAKGNAPYFSDILKDVDAKDITSREALAALPVTRKSDLVERQQKDAPFGGLNGEAIADIAHIFQSPGPIYEPRGNTTDYWRMARSFWAAGIRPGMIVHNTFSYHLTPAGMMMDGGARAIGCAVFPGGTGNTEQQIAAMLHLKPQAYAGTPSFLKILLDKAAEAGVKPSYTSATVGGEALLPPVRQSIIDHGVTVLQGYGTADLGLIAYETKAMEGMVMDEGALVEIVRPGSGDPVADGEVGEVVVTILNKTYPLVRFATGDLSAVMAGQSPCGRTNKRIKGWMGRADQTTKIKGMFVHPEQVNQTADRHPEIFKARLVVDNIDGKDIMTLHCEVEGNPEGLKEAVTASLQSVSKLNGTVEFVAPGSLANDGKVIDDVRSYE
jgi:phenylacetate-CoA ligase